MKNNPKTVRVALDVASDVAHSISEYRHKNGLTTTGAAVRRLVELGLQRDREPPSTALAAPHEAPSSPGGATLASRLGVKRVGFAQFPVDEKLIPENYKKWNTELPSHIFDQLEWLCREYDITKKDAAIEAISDLLCRELPLVDQKKPRRHHPKR
jgi:hypothetical protein